MSNDMFGGLGGLMKGFSAFMPQDDPNTKIFALQNEINELSGKETELYADIGKKVYPSVCQQAEYSAIASELKDIQNRLTRLQNDLEAAKTVKEQKEKQEEEERMQSTCPNCGAVFEPGLKFCNECGSKLGLPTKAACPSCGAVNAPETKFCGECGTKL